MLRVIGNDESLARQERVLASGTLPSGKPVVVNSDGTVSVVGISSATAAIGSESVFESATMSNISSTFDSSNNKVVISYKDAGNGGHGTAVVGTVTASDNSISFGTPVVFNAASTSRTAITFDSSNNKVVIGYADNGDSDKGKAIVGTVSGTSISFGSAQQFTSSSDSVNADFAASFDSSANKVVFSWRNNSGGTKTGKSIVGTVSGTSISFGTAATFESGAADKISAAYDANADRTVVLYRDDGNSNYTSVAVGTISGTSISFGTPVVITSSAMSGDSTAIAYDSTNQKLALFYSRSSEGKVAVGVVSGTSITITERPTYGFESGNAHALSAVYDANANLVVVAYRDPQDSSKGKIALPRISGTDILDPNDTMPNAGGHGTPTVFEAGTVTQPTTLAYDSNAKKVVVSYTDDNNSEHGTSRVVQNAYSNANLTSENYIGILRGSVFNTGSAASVGSTATYNSGSTEAKMGAVYDSNSNRVVIAYKDAGNSNFGTAIVGTVSGTSISFGTEVVFLSSANDDGGVAFDSTNNKVVITTKDTGSGNDGKAFVGTVDPSDNSISFGSAATYDTNSPGRNGVTFDSVSGKVAVFYTEGSSPFQGRVRIGTVSGTDISFGTEANLSSNRPNSLEAVFNSDGKLIIAFRDVDNSLGKVVVGTISGTDISFGSETSLGVNANPKAAVYDSSNDKVLILYEDVSTSDALTGVVATVSGTSVSVGSAVRINGTSSASDLYVSGAAYNASTGTIVAAFRDRSNSNKGSAVDITISGTSLSVSDKLVFEAGDTRFMNTAYDSTAEKVVIGFRDHDDSSIGKALVYSSDTRAVTRGQVTDGNNGIIDTQGGISENQLSLSPGKRYFVQTDGTLATSAGNPSVIAGTAVSATKLIVKG
tara:strand:- start:2565 stop:5219 length:2655 start_codon:yes stop_codon:yes gene_type:complete